MNDNIIWDPTRLILQTVNYPRRRQELIHMPCLRFEDMAVTCRLLLRQDEASWVSVQVTDDMVRGKMGEEELFRTAGANSRRLLPPVVEDIRDVLKEYAADESLENDPENVENALRSAGARPEKADGFEEGLMYVVTNQKRIFGASTLFYSDVLHKLAEALDGDLLILPSSIHEVLALPYMGNEYDAAFRDMVRHANQTVVLEKEILSDSIYRYHRKQQRLSLID